ADPQDRWAPEATIVTEPAALAAARGMRMGYAPVVAAVEHARDLGFKRLAVIALPCQSYALRSLEPGLGLEALYLIGTPCSDNTSTEHFHRFLAALDPQPERIRYLEFCPDYHVELRYEDGPVRRIPFLQLPLQDLGDDFFPLTCQSCVDYTNSLADITVGYMAGSGEQWVVVRNDRGAALLAGLDRKVVLSPLESRGKRQGPVQGFLENTRRAAGGLPLRRLPAFLRPLMGWLMPRVGPRGLEFARARLEMKAIEAVLHLRRARPARLRHMLPSHLWALVKPYGLSPTGEEQTPS
ncbi:MAG: Coenzyme F420 hydrogenase/dehydrogenase, beta subunit C-terminal domain, partial [Pseudomonadota bacterium]|nr:Coenzyme F420 hydrogenase/dehydrogenase, beta subunit C-terminal domain [Pseudomonadota bacterium]